MDYFVGLDVSIEKTHACVVDRDGGGHSLGESAI
jgi:hypothetical protein